MSKIALSGNASGSGTFTLAAPNSDSSYTLTLPAVSGGTLVSTDASGNVGFGANLSYAGTLTGSSGILNIGSGQIYKAANGYVGFGTSNPRSSIDIGDGTTQKVVIVAGSNSGTSGGGSIVVQNTTSQSIIGIGNYSALNGGSYSGSPTVWFQQTLSFYDNTSERMRIDSAGNVLIGTTDANDNGTIGFKLRKSGIGATINCTFNSPDAGSTYQLYNLNASYSGYRFYVNYNGGINNYQTYNTNLSDERSKKNIELAKPYLSILCSIPVKLFHYKDEPENVQKNLGVIAQDVERVAPELVSNEGFGELPEDGIPLKTIYETDLKYAMLKAIQELKAEVDALKAEVAALKSA